MTFHPIQHTRSVRNTLYEAWAMRRVWWFTATARTKARFARTFFGSFWLGLSNLFSIAALAFVYGTVFKVQDFNEYVVYIGIGLVIWNTITSAIGSAPNLFENNQAHVHNTNLNPVFYTLEEWSFQIQTFAQSFLLVILGLSFFQHDLFLNFLIVGWLPIINLFLFLFWGPLFVCLLGAKYRDLYQLVPIVLQLIFLLSPILYQKERLGGLVWTANFNPLYRILSDCRNALMNSSIEWNNSFFILIINLFLVWLALKVLNKESSNLPFLI